MPFTSEIRELGPVAIPAYSGVRVMMMPFLLEEPERSLPEALAPWRAAVRELVGMSPARAGTGYLTVDEAEVAPGEFHRRPGMHVDGLGGWGGGGGGWGARGMVLASSLQACRGWAQTFSGEPGHDGDCSHLAGQCDPSREVLMRAGAAYWCSPLAVHESLRMPDGGRRQFVRVSMPSDAPWYEGYTENPLGVRPTGPILPRRSSQMAFRP